MSERSCRSSEPEPEEILPRKPGHPSCAGIPVSFLACGTPASLCSKTRRTRSPGLRLCKLEL
uniref:Uncharacterized protein n=1 Tax=Siphoviridae sp. ctNwR4 TaxID=2825474 RepID=A0A8S5P1U7_9CAUD|nr:MAG TPA: hypothetical protein [Siphoviridae sp. ctNwR4]